MPKLRIGLIGCGKQAPKHISGLKTDPDVEIVLADINETYAKSLGEKEGVDWVKNIDELFSDPTIKAVDICTPTPSHAPLIRKAIESGKHFFCEKPFSDKIEEARELEKLSAEHNLVGMVGYIYRFAPIFEEGKKILQGVDETGESTTLGEICTAYFRLGGRGSHQVWKHRKKTGGGALSEMLVHMIDLAIWYFGPPEAVQVLSYDLLRKQRQIQGELVEVDAEDFVLVKLYTKYGLEVYCQADLVTPAFTQFIEVQGDAGSFMGSIQPHMPSYLYIDRDAGQYKRGKNDLTFAPPNLFVNQMSEFLSAVKENRPPAKSTVSDSVLVMETIEKIKERI